LKRLPRACVWIGSEKFAGHEQIVTYDSLDYFAAEPIAALALSPSLQVISRYKGWTGVVDALAYLSVPSTVM
jgi:hypothetical protein